MKVNTTIYGPPQTIYPNYTPLDSSRSSSLNTTNYPHAIHLANSRNRPENSSPVLVMREMSRNNLNGSQVGQLGQQQYKSKGLIHEYYSQSKSEEMIRRVQQKIDELTRKVIKNTEDIDQLKDKEKTVSFTMESSIVLQLNKVEERQEVNKKECLLQIQALKAQVADCCINFAKIQRESTEKINSKSEDKLVMRLKNMVQERVKQETAKVRLIIQNESNKLAHELKWQLKRDQLNLNPIKSKLKYPFRSTKLVYSQFIELSKKQRDRLSTKSSNDSPRSVKLGSQKIYFVDGDGYLLDQDNYYLLDQSMQMIRLNQEMLEQLQREGVLKCD